MRPTMSRRAFAISLASAAVAPRAFAQAESISFLVVGDWGERSAGQIAVADAMGRVAADITSAFVVSTGDNFYSRGVTSVEDQQWVATFENAFTAPSLQTPWYPVLGNHDYRGSVSAEINYSNRSARWRMPSRYWRQDVMLGAETASFFMLDTFPLTHLAAMRSRTPFIGDSAEAHAQLRWLEAELRQSQARWKFAVGHHPVLSSGSHGGSAALLEHLKPLLERFGVRAYFNGHDHNLEHLRDGGVDYICSGAGSEFRPMRAALPQTTFAYGGFGFASCRLSGDGLLLRFHDQSGAELYSAEIA